MNEELIPLTPEETVTDVAERRKDIDAKQAIVARVLKSMECEAAVLLMPAHVAWFTAGMNVRGLLSDTERPGVYTNGIQRWLLSSNVDTFRLFHEELDGLGFQLKEWPWKTGRATLLGELVVGKKVAVDRPYPGLPLINDKLRILLRPLSSYEQDRFLTLGAILAHAVEATARTFDQGVSEEEIAGQLAHRLLHRGTEAVGISITADGRGARFRRAGFTPTPVTKSCVIQATGSRDGLFATCSRMVHFGPVDNTFKTEIDLACKTSALFQSKSKPTETMTAAGDAGAWVLANTPYEYDWRLNSPGFGTGRLPGEELRRMNQDEPFALGQGLVWQARVGAAAVVDTVLVSYDGPVVATPTEGWPFKRIKLKDVPFDIPDILIRD